MSLEQLQIRISLFFKIWI